VPGLGSGLVVVQGPDFGPQWRSVISSPDSVAEDRDNDPSSAPKQPLHGREGDWADASLDELRAAWRRLYRSEPPRISGDLLHRGIAYRHQELKHGGLGKTTRRKLKTLAKMFRTTGRVSPDPGLALKPVARLVREWHGRTHTVTVTEDGFEYAGTSYASLTKIAKKITGAHWSGPRFFGLS
jgi:hypothetical protein